MSGAASTNVVGRPPLLSAAGLRIDVAGICRVADLSFDTGTDHCALLGDVAPLFAAIDGTAEQYAGKLSVSGLRASEALRQSVVGLCRQRDHLPIATTGFEYLVRSAILAGHARGNEKWMVERLLAEFGLIEAAKKSLAQCSVAETRALMLAHATTGLPQALLVEAPLAGLDTESQAFVGRALEKALDGRRYCVSVRDRHDPAERALLQQAEEVLVFDAGSVVLRGSAAEVLTSAARFLIVVSRNAAPLAQALIDAGHRLAWHRADGAVEPLSSAVTVTDSARFVVELRTGSNPRDILAQSLSAKAPVLELLPLAAARFPL